MITSALQAEPRIQPVAKRDAADQRAQVEVEGVARRRRSPTTCAAAGRGRSRAGRSGRSCSRARGWRPRGRAASSSVPAGRRAARSSTARQSTLRAWLATSPSTATKNSDRQRRAWPPDTRAGRAAARRPRAAAARVERRQRVSGHVRASGPRFARAAVAVCGVRRRGCDGLERGACRGSQPAQAGKRRRKWNTRAAAQLRPATPARGRRHARSAGIRGRSGAASRSRRQSAKARSRSTTLASRFSDRLSGSRLLEPTVAQSSSTTATLPCSGRLQYSWILHAVALQVVVEQRRRRLDDRHVGLALQDQVHVDAAPRGAAQLAQQPVAGEEVGVGDDHAACARCGSRRGSGARCRRGARWLSRVTNSACAPPAARRRQRRRPAPAPWRRARRGRIAATTKRWISSTIGPCSSTA